MTSLSRATGSRATGTRTRRPSGDRGDVVVGWLVKVIATLGILGVIGFDALSIGTASVSLEDQSVAAARAGQDAYVQTPNVMAAYEAAVASATQSNQLNEIDPSELVLASDGTVTVTIHRTAPTLVLHYIGPLKHWADRTASASAAPIR